MASKDRKYDMVFKFENGTFELNDCARPCFTDEMYDTLDGNMEFLGPGNIKQITIKFKKKC